MKAPEKNLPNLQKRSNNQNTLPFAFFGSSRFSVLVLDELARAGLSPSFVVTTPDKPQGRKMVMTPTPVKAWAMERNIQVYSPTQLDTEFANTLKTLTEAITTAIAPKFFLVASYGKIIPQIVLDVLPNKTINIHPSLLPKYRGASPLQSAILDDSKDTGVTIMQIDAAMDHGPIIAQEKVHLNEWPVYEEFETIMATKGAQLLARTLPDWIAGKIKPIEQNHGAATFTKKITKENGLVDFADQYLAFRKIQAFHEWPQAYFFIEHADKKLRIKITRAKWQPVTNIAPAKLIIEKVIPEGSKEMSYDDFTRGYKIS